jgi:hypothetical protein
MNESPERRLMAGPVEHDQRPPLYQRVKVVPPTRHCEVIAPDHEGKRALGVLHLQR